MSKSEGNFVTINELLETEKFGGRKWPGEVLRLAMLMTHYREPIDLTVQRLEEARNTICEVAIAGPTRQRRSILPPGMPRFRAEADLDDSECGPQIRHRVHDRKGLAGGCKEARESRRHA